MLRSIRQLQNPRQRRGVILLVVLALLTMFAIVGLTFFFYAESQSESSRIWRDSQNKLVLPYPELPRTALLESFLAQLIWDVPDSGDYLYSSLRGHSMIRTMYGYNDAGTNDVPYNGIGRIHTAGSDEYYNIHCMYFNQDQPTVIHDPERAGTRNSPNPTARKPYVAGNAPYTYPDLNTMFLAAVKADGTVLCPSFHRPFMDPANPSQPAQGYFGSLDPTNPSWYTKNDPIKYRVMRLRPADMGYGFPGTLKDPNNPNYPGDVKNLGTTKGYDSIWIDIGYPVTTLADGRKYKPLFAPLIIDLDNRINLNTAGNIRRPAPVGGSADHVSNQGWGPWEVNLRYVLPAQLSPIQYEWPNLFQGNSSGTITGRYGSDNQPTYNLPINLPGNSSGKAFQAPLPYYYGQIDFDGCNEQANYALTNPITLPAAGSNLLYPSYQPGYGNAGANELTNHPMKYSYWQAANNGDKVFGVDNMGVMLTDTSNNFSKLDLGTLLKQSLAPGSRSRGLVTTSSFDPDRPGVVPWVWDPNDPTTDANGSFLYRFRLEPSTLAPKGGPIPFPQFTSAGTAPTNSEFGATDWGAVKRLVGTLGNRVDLNRTLRKYPDYDPATGRIDLTGNGGQNQIDFNNAQADRQTLALDIYNCLVSVTGAQSLATKPSPEYDALRYLAQLAVNIVDYIDYDDYMTPFSPPPLNGNSEVVYGTEMPRVVLNEVYGQWESDPADTGVNAKATYHNVYLWAELYNTNPTSNTFYSAYSANTGEVDGTVELKNGSGDEVYQLVLCKPDPHSFNAVGAASYYRHPENLTGTPFKMNAADPDLIYKVDGATAATTNAVVADWGTTPTQKTVPAYGFYLIGPKLLPGGTPPAQNVTMTQMSYQFKSTDLTNIKVPDRPTVMLRRLACEHLPFNAASNPYITVDYVENVRLNDASDFTVTGPNTPVPVDQRYSVGRTQPFSAQWLLNQPQQGAATLQPQNTFGLTNGPVPTGKQDPFDWLVHLDRALVSPMELLQVSAYKPHELTQQFHSPATTVSLTPVTASDLNKAFTIQLPNLPVSANGQGLSVMTPDGPFNIAVGQNLVVDQGNDTSTVGNVDRAETVTVSAVNVNAKTFDATFTKIHPTFFPIYSPGVNNPSPAYYRFNQRAHWFDERQRICRALEFLETGNRAADMFGGIGQRQPGKININTIFDDPNNPTDPLMSRGIFEAICDPNGSGHFTLAHVDNMYKQFLNYRTPNVQPGPNDRPFRGLATPFTAAGDLQYPNGIGLDDTLLRNDAANGRRLFEVPGQSHPYMKYEMLNKMYNNITTRSNVFAVWVTVGFFEVLQEKDLQGNPVRPVKLGAEIGADQGRNIRHKLFAIIDRSALTKIDSSVTPTTSTTAVTAPGLTQITPASMANIQAGTIITVVDQNGTNMETVVVSELVYTGGPPATATAFKATFQKTHAANFVINFTKPGNPGPQPQFTLKDNGAVVPYWTPVN